MSSTIWKTHSISGITPVSTLYLRLYISAMNYSYTDDRKWHQEEGSSRATSRRTAPSFGVERSLLASEVSIIRLLLCNITDLCQIGARRAKKVSTPFDVCICRLHWAPSTIICKASSGLYFEPCLWTAHQVRPDARDQTFRCPVLMAPSRPSLTTTLFVSNI